MQTTTSAAVLHCDQAVFTSVRGTMGEGYRIIAGSRGLRPDEKQAITRLSPSHDSLCWQPTSKTNASSYAAAFYPLPTGRLCVAYSCYAGPEHTARGGHRVYTQNVVFDEKDFPRCGFNPFHVVRAMAVEGLTVPKLTSGSVLPEVQLPISNNGVPQGASFASSFNSPHRLYVLQCLFDERALIVPVQDGWLESAEALLMGIPGPMRVKVTFAAGLRFSLSRCHRLHLLCDDKGAARSRIVGQPVEYLDPNETLPNGSVSTWLTFVDRHWSQADCAVLARRTSRPFTDFTHAARERIGKLYIAMNAVPLTASLELLSLAADHVTTAPTPLSVGGTVHGRSADMEDEIRRELLAAAQRTLRDRLTNIRWHDAQQLWPRLIAFWCLTDAAFAQPLLEAALRSLVRDDPLTTAEAAIDIASCLPSAVDQGRHDRLIDEVLTRVAAHLPADTAPERLTRLCSRWQFVRPEHPALRELLDRCSPAQTANSASR